MNRLVTLRAAAHDLVFDAQGRASCTILARNGGDRAVRVKPTLVSLDDAKSAWATLKDGAERDLAPGEEAQFEVVIAKPHAKWSFGRRTQHAFRVALLDKDDATIRDESKVITVRTRQRGTTSLLVSGFLAAIVIFRIWHFTIIEERVGVTTAMTFVSVDTSLELDGGASDQLADLRMIAVEAPSRTTTGRTAGLPGRSPSPAPHVPDLQTNRVFLVPLNGATIGRSSSFFGIRTCRGGLQAETINLSSVCVRTTRGQIVELQIVKTTDRIQYGGIGNMTTQVDTVSADFAQKVYWRWLYWR